MRQKIIFGSLQESNGILYHVNMNSEKVIRLKYLFFPLITDSVTISLITQIRTF